MKTGIVPGTFDPITNGHLDIVRRAGKFFDEVVVAVAESHGKRPLFTLEERVELARASLSGVEGVRVEGFSGLLRDFVAEQGGMAVVKGLRAMTDFEYEFQMSAVNYQLEESFETIFVMSAPQYMYLSSSVVREISSFGGEVGMFVPAVVERALREKFASRD